MLKLKHTVTITCKWHQQKYDYLQKNIRETIDLFKNTKEQVCLLNKSNNKITNLEKEKEHQTDLTPIFKENTQPRRNQTWKHRPIQEHKILNMLALTNLVN